MWNCKLCAHDVHEKWANKAQLSLQVFFLLEAKKNLFPTHYNICTTKPSQLLKERTSDEACGQRLMEKQYELHALQTEEWEFISAQNSKACHEIFLWKEVHACTQYQHILGLTLLLTEQWFCSLEVSLCHWYVNKHFFLDLC